MEALAFVLTSGWASGINLYATVLSAGSRADTAASTSSRIHSSEPTC